jgi:hypothetical protein
VHLILAAAALAATPVVHGGDPTEAVQVASRASGVALWELRPVAVGDLFPGEGALRVGAGQPAACVGKSSTSGELRDVIAVAEKLYLRQSWADVRARAAEADARIPCLGEGAEPSQLARLAFLDGFAAAEMGDTAGATRSFARAHAWDPALTWDERVSGAGRASFDAAVAPGGEPGTLVLGPGAAALGTVWAIDGRVVALSAEQALALGRHLVQTLQPAVRTWEIEVSAGHAVALVDAAAARASVLGGGGKPLERGVLAAAVDERLGGDSSALVLAEGKVWRVGSWEALPIPAEPAAPRVDPGRARLSAGLLGGGLTALALGGGLAVAGAITHEEADVLIPE